MANKENIIKEFYEAVNSFNNVIELILWLFSRKPRNVACFVSRFSTTEVLAPENFHFFIMKMKAIKFD